MSVNKFKVIKDMSTARIKLNLGLALGGRKIYEGKYILLALELKRRKQAERTEFVKKILEFFDIEEWDPD